MKTDIHPKYFPAAKVKCVCGNSYTVGSTKENIVDSAGRVEKFRTRLSKKTTTSVVKKDRKTSKK